LSYRIFDIESRMISNELRELRLEQTFAHELVTSYNFLDEKKREALSTSFSRIHSEDIDQLYLFDIQPCQSRINSLFLPSETDSLHEPDAYLRALVNFLTGRPGTEGKFIPIAEQSIPLKSMHTAVKTNSIQILQNVLQRAYPAIVHEEFFNSWGNIFKEGYPDKVIDLLWYVADSVFSSAAFYVSAFNTTINRLNTGDMRDPDVYIRDFSVYNLFPFFDDARKHAATLTAFLYGREGLMEADFIFRLLLASHKPVYLQRYNFHYGTDIFEYQADTILNKPILPSTYTDTSGLGLKERKLGDTL
jgi:hypothetical protein